jgi:hypothetical protein
MPIELLCGQCQGRLLAEQPGSVVACPHCGTHLHVPGVAAEEKLKSTAPQASAAALITSSLETADDAEPEPAAPPAPLVSVAETMALEEAAASAIVSPAAIPLAETQSPPRQATPSPRPPVKVSNVAPAQPVSTAAPPAAVAAVPRFWFTLLLGYSSAVTLALLYLLYVISGIKAHPLESLPDIVPQVRNGEVELKVARPEYDVAPGHVVKLGETRRFGILNVTPLRITRGPVAFERILPVLKDKETLLKGPPPNRPPSRPVLKLWLRFENISAGQTFSPLDPQLLFRREYQGAGQPAMTNQFLCEQSERRSEGDLRYLFELPTTSEFRLVGQHLETKLGPGESLETFIPSEENIDDLDGDIVWRVQFRKGYHPRTRHGVTTLIDVTFQRKDVQLET